MVKASGSWHIWVDTGGTFTDCLALSPEGCLQRAKVLSSGRLRVQGEAPEEDGSIRITSPVPLPDGFLDGVRLLIPASGEPLGTIQSYDTATGQCRLSPPFTPTSQPGSLLELDFQVEAPILAARLVTRTGPGHSLPPCQFHLATTKSTNALLERKGDRTAFLVTRGFKDLLLIGDQKRSDL
ncbi:MAG: hypothetical protein MI810_08340, partial [Flavobacteriales bacterium]|nr:hypothetical protein [Flavobacteriales bacterium]